MATEVHETTEVPTELPNQDDFFDAVKPLEAELQRATEHLDGLNGEFAELQPLKDQAVLDGDAGLYTKVAERQRELPAEILMARIATAKANVRVCEAKHEAALAFREATGQYGLTVSAERGYPRGLAKAGEASQMYDGARSTVSATSQAMANANRALRETMAQAEGR